MCKILAVRLNHQAFKEWIGYELHGYTQAQLPEYRVLNNLTCRGKFKINFEGEGAILPIPTERLITALVHKVTTKYVCEGVRALEGMVRQAYLGNQLTINIQWTNEVRDKIIISEMESKYRCYEAWTEVPTFELVGILDTIRTRVLDFVLEIEAEAPDAGEVKPRAEPIPQSVVNQYFHECILHQPNQSAQTGLITNHQEATSSSDSYTNNLQGADVGNVANQVNDSASQQAN
jgi:hypothetical protein